jgi:hypothetical protein
MPKLAENTSRFLIHPEREIALLGRPVARRIGSGPLDDQWSFFAEIFSQLRVCGFVRLIALRPPGGLKAVMKTLALIAKPMENVG